MTAGTLLLRHTTADAVALGIVPKGVGTIEEYAPHPLPQLLGPGGSGALPRELLAILTLGK